jgi:hypothetical protein
MVTDSKARWKGITRLHSSTAEVHAAPVPLDLVQGTAMPAAGWCYRESSPAVDHVTGRAFQKMADDPNTETVVLSWLRSSDLCIPVRVVKRRQILSLVSLHHITSQAWASAAVAATTSPIQTEWPLRIWQPSIAQQQTAMPQLQNSLSRLVQPWMLQTIRAAQRSTGRQSKDTPLWCNCC